MFKTLGKYLPPPAGVNRPALWGTRARLNEMFGPAATSIKAVPRNFNFRYRSAEHFIEVFKNLLRPDAQGVRSARRGRQQTKLKNDLYALIARMNKADDGTMVVPSEYLEVVILKR